MKPWSFLAAADWGFALREEKGETKNTRRLLGAVWDPKVRGAGIFGRGGGGPSGGRAGPGAHGQAESSAGQDRVGPGGPTPLELSLSR